MMRIIPDKALKKTPTMYRLQNMEERERGKEIKME
jgi:hypothetical protein